MIPGQLWKQERPDWCPHKDCNFKRRVQDSICGGHLPKPEPHNGGFNNHRICLNHALPDNEVFDLMVNDGDLDYFRWVFDVLDGKKTSWLSNIKINK